MKIINIDQNSDQWLELRKGKITGSKLKDIIVKRGNGKKIGFYQLIADRVATEPDDENPMDRGHRLEQEAIKLFEQTNGVSVISNGMWIADWNEDVAISPDGSFNDYKDAVEVKCLSSAKHLQALIEKDIPSEYLEQAVQYFIVNDDLERLHFVFFDPRIGAKPYHEIVIERNATITELVEKYKDYQLKILDEVNTWVEGLAF